MHIEWSDKYKVGDPEIDMQHEDLFRKINNFLEATNKEDWTLAAAKLFQYTRVHFKHEEVLMRAIDYPELQAHVALHNGLLTRLNAIAEEIAEDRLDKEKWKSFLSDWLLYHIANVDARLALYVERC
jgi:hemerythrin